MRLRPARADQINAAAMRLLVDPADLRDDLLEFLRASSCLAVKHGADEIDVHLLNSLSDRHDRAVVAGCVEAWKATRDASVAFLSG
jgi:hypothetical protein